ncbi:hypothetical protein K0P33_19785 [Pseudomonas sp. ArH3a]|uniref:NEL-type E3 ubiquitin ligase domain-containing protein n=1 Tax=Pseudomonas sp. ArH3a TaxID=2862945 RepID=UPI001F57F77B|nr:NEL-type E3 ubiquitin ligase domain-containing protein [Pseudomonas sp. ArH3a]UNM17801.1 hypothetical protein K0P33_19785 [Pseudomonas sp. ArH3a]
MACLEQNESTPINAALSVHSVVVQARLPAWYGAAASKRKKELHEWALSLPDWYKKISPDNRLRMEAAHQRSSDALNKLDKVLKDLKGAIEFAEPLLLTAMCKKFGKVVDVKRVFFARKEFMPRDRSKVFGLEASGYCYYKGVSLVEAALQNFSADEAVEAEDTSSRVITRYDFHRQPAPSTFNEAEVLARKEPLSAHEFAGLCRELDLGALYLAHVTSIVNPPDKGGVAEGSAAARVRSAITASTREQLLFAAEVALEVEAIKQDTYSALGELAFWKAGVKWRDEPVQFTALKLLHVELTQIIVIGPVSFSYVRGVKVFNKGPCVVYIPGDPVCMLKEYAGLGAFQTDLVERLCSAQYRRFFSQHVPYEQQTGFFKTLKHHLDPGNAYAEDADFDPHKKNINTWSTGYGEALPQTWTDHSRQKVELILSNAQAMATSTAKADDNAHNAWLMSLASIALTVLNVASFVVPQLAPVMLMIGAVQMLYEITTGVEAWEEGDMKEAWAHVSAVAFNVTTTALGAKLLPLAQTPFVDALAHVRCPDANVRLSAPGLNPYLRQVDLPETSAANANGLFEHEGGLYLPDKDGHYLVEALGTGNTYKILHPHNPSAYSPQVRRTEGGAWIHEHEHPLQWAAPQLMQRLGSGTKTFAGDPDKLERICEIAAADSSVLRKMYVDQAPVPGLLADTLKRFEIDETLAGETPAVKASSLAGHQADLFAQRYAAAESESAEALKLLKRAFVSLPDSIARELLSHASEAEMQMIEQHQRVPFRLGEEARYYQQEVRLARAYEGLYRKTLGNNDTQRMVLHSLNKLEGWPTDLRIDVVEKGAGGKERLLDSLGPQDATVTRRLIKFGSANLYEVQDDRFGVLTGQADIYGAVHAAISPENRVSLKLTANDRGASLKQALEKQPLMPRGELRNLLKMQPIKPGYKPPMRLADGRIGYLLSPLPSTVKRAFACEMKAAILYPSKSMAEVEAFLGLQGLADAEVLARLTELEGELEQLKATLHTWEQEGRPDGYGRSRARVSHTIRDAWQRSLTQALAGDRTPIGHILDLSDEVIGELPTLTANMSHVGCLRLNRMALTNESLGFLRAFGGLRWLSMRNNNLTQLPEFANNGIGLTKLYLNGNDIRLTALTKARLEGMQGLKILDLAYNRQLGWTANLEGMWSLNQLNLRHTGTTTFPAGAGQLANLARIDLHSNQLTTLPEYAYQRIERINYHENPLSADTRVRLGLDAPADVHVTVEEGRRLWLDGAPTAVQAVRARLWDDALASPESAAFFSMLADTTRCAEYRSTTTRAQLTERVWDMLEAVNEYQEIRERLFAVADDRFTCGDGSVVEFMNSEREVLALQTLALADEAGAETQLITTGRKLFRLDLVDAIAQRDVDLRGSSFQEPVEVILAYRIKLADRLALPVKSRDMLFPEVASVSQGAIDDAYASVLRDERVHADEESFFIKLGFWDKHLRSHYAPRLEQLMAPGLEPINEKSTALYDVSDLQGEEDIKADTAAQAQWLVKRNAAVDRLARLLGKQRDDILVDDAMQSGFFEKQLQALSSARNVQERIALKALTRQVLGTHDAAQVAQV